MCVTQEGGGISRKKVMSLTQSLSVLILSKVIFRSHVSLEVLIILQGVILKTSQRLSASDMGAFNYYVRI